MALLIGCSDYEDSEFRQLPAPARDIDDLTRVLEDPTIGDFTVDTLLNGSYGTVNERIEVFFAHRKPDDLLLLYFSCHGVLDSRLQLHFVAANTRREQLASTGVSAQWVKQRMDQSRSKRIVLLLDCCYSGAFGATRGSADTEKIFEQLGGRGRVIITASDKQEIAYESVFTDAVVGGLQTGDADRDGDGLVSVYELYKYVHDQVRKKRPDQTPTLSADGMCGELYLAKNPHAPSPLPEDLDRALRSETVWQRRGAIDGLQRLIAGNNPGGLKRTARQALDNLRKVDPDPDIREAAKEALGTVPPLPPPPPPDRRLVKVAATVVMVLGVLLSATYLSPRDKSPTDKPIACSPSTRPADGVLSLGTILPISGTFISVSLATSAGVDLAIKEIYESGGIPGIEMKLADTNRRDEGGLSGAAVIQSTDALLSSGVDVVIGPATSEATSKIIDKATCGGMVIFSPSNSASLFTDYHDHGLYFRTMSPAVSEASVLGRLIADDGNRTVVVISRDDVFGRSLREATEKKIRELGKQVTGFSYDIDTLHYDKEIQQVKDKNPDAIVLIGFNESADIISRMIQEGLGPNNKKVYVVNMTNSLAGQVRPQTPEALAGMKGTMETGDDAFVKRLREANPGLQDSTYAAQAYDAVVITALATALARTDEPAAIAKEINGVTKAGEKCASFAACMALVKERKDIDYDGAAGPLEFTEPGEPSSTIYVINEIQADGTVKPIRKVRVGPGDK